MIDATRIKQFPTTIPIAKRKSREYRLILLLGLLHVPLGILIYNFAAVGVIHQVVVILMAVNWAVQKQVRFERVVIMVTYLVGAEVLWRMAGVSIFWELAKYAGAGIFVIALVSRRLYQIRILPSLYFLALIPACLITINDHSWSSSRQVLSSGMSGPLFLAVSCIALSHLEVTPHAIRRIMTALILPLLSVGFSTLFYTVSTPDIQFTQESNFVTSGGFGPNQVSAMLGAGAFASLLLLVIFPNSVKEKLVLGMVALFLTSQSVLTFSRGGMYAAIGAIFAASLVLLRDPPTALRRLAPIVLASLIFLGTIFPFLDSVTGGELRNRFEDTQGSARTEIIEADFNIFLENLLIGAGVGAAYELRAQYLNRKAMSHTEFTRLIAEHGIFGVFATLILLALAITNFRRQKSIFGKSFVLGITVWAVLFMSNAGMRLAAPSLMWGLTCVTIARRRAHLKPAPPARFGK